MIVIRLYHTGDDPGTESTRRELDSLQKEFPHRRVDVEISNEPAVQARFGGSLPAIQAGPYTLRWPFSATDIRITLSSAQQSEGPETQGRSRTDAQGRRSRRAERWALAVARHWLLGVNLFIAALLGLPFLAPVLMKAGAPQPAGWIYSLYSPLCHQLGFRSWFLFGEQAAYPRSIVADESISFGEATGLPESDYAAARAFRGDEVVGYKVAFCQRDVAMYGGILLAGVAYALFRRHLPELPWWAWLAFGVLPIALDGGSQLASGWGWIPGYVRESTPWLRTLTGLGFGAFTVWFAFPQVEATMAETRSLIRAQMESSPSPK